MRKFGTDKQEFMAFTLGNAKKEYKLPLAASMPADELLELYAAYQEGEREAFESQMKLLHRYIGDAASKLTAGDVRDIFEAWTEDSGEQGAEPGES